MFQELDSFAILPSVIIIQIIQQEDSSLSLIIYYLIHIIKLIQINMQPDHSNHPSQLKPFSDLKSSFVSHDSKQSKDNKGPEINQEIKEALNIEQKNSNSKAHSPFKSSPTRKTQEADLAFSQKELATHFKDQKSPTFYAEKDQVKTDIISKEITLQDPKSPDRVKGPSEVQQKLSPLQHDRLIQSQTQSTTHVDANMSFQNDTSKDQSSKINVGGSNQGLNFDKKTTVQNRGRKRKTAKDDMCSDMNLRRQGPRISFHHQMEQEEPRVDETEKTQKEGNIFHIDRPLKTQGPMRKPKRKMSDQNINLIDLKPNLVAEDENEFDLAQSLLTLQINIHNKQPDRRFGQSQFHPSLIKQKTQISNSNPLRGIFTNRDKSNNLDAIARRNSNFASASKSSFNGENSNGSDQDDDGDDDKEDAESADISIQLDDGDLQFLIKLFADAQLSQEGLNTHIQNTISTAEESNKRALNDRQTNEIAETGEYASLMWGQSIWSTDVARESKKQFIQNLQQMTGSDIANMQAEHKKNLDDTDDFEQISKNIQQKTQAVVNQESDQIKHVQSSESPPAFNSPDEQTEAKLQPMPNLQMPAIQNNVTQQQSHYQIGENNQYMPQTNQYQPDVGINHQNYAHIEPMQAQQLIAGMQQPPYNESQPTQFIQQQPIVDQNQKDFYKGQQASAAYDQNYYQYPNQPVVNDEFGAPKQVQQQIQDNQYGNEYQEMKNSSAVKQTFNSGISVHSGGHVALPGHHHYPMGVNDHGPEFPDNASSNYTHHPYSAYGQGQQSHPSFQNNHSQAFNAGRRDNMNHNGNNSLNQNRAHIFINRHINRYMMNPIYKSRQTVTSLQMHKYSGVPWRGGNTQLHNLAQIQHMQTNAPQNHAQLFENLNMPQMQTSYNQNPSGQMLPEQNQSKGQFIPHLGQQQIPHANAQYQNFMLNQPSNPDQKDTNFIVPHQQELNQQQQFQNPKLLDQPNQMQSHIENQSQDLTPKFTTEAQEGIIGQNFQQQPRSQEMLQESYQIPDKNNNFQPPQYPLVQQTAQQNQSSTINAQPFYPKDWEQQKMKRQINESAHILGAGNTRNVIRQKATPAIHVPIPIPIMRKGGFQKGGNQARHLKKTGFEQDYQNADAAEINNQNSNSIFMKDFFRQDILSKKNELDMRMKEVSKRLESKMIKAVEINEQDDDQEIEEEELTIEVMSANDGHSETVSVERSESTHNKSINIRDLKHHLGGGAHINIKNKAQRKNSDNDPLDQKQNIKTYEERIKRKTERAEIFKKLQQQLNEFKNMGEMINDQTSGIGGNNASSMSPKRSTDLINKQNESTQIDLVNKNRLTPFKQDAKQYMDKVLNLMNIINEVDDLTNVAELKNRLEKQKLMLLKSKAERNEFIQQLQKIIQEQQINELNHKQQVQSYQSQLSESQNLVQTLNQNLESMREQKEFQERQIFELTSQMEQLKQENHSLILQTQDLQTQIQDSAKIYGNQIQNITNLKDQMQNTIISQHNQIAQYNNQIEQLNNNNMQVQQNLNQQQIENQKLTQNLDNMESQKAKLEDEQEKLMKQVKSTKKTSGVSNESGGKGSSQDHVPDDSDDFQIPLEEQLENANQQIKDLQEYIKKRGMDDLKSSQMRQENYQENFNKLKKQKDDMEREKDRTIKHLKDFIKNHNEPILIGSLGSSMMVGESRKDFKDATQINTGRINDTSTIDGRSFNESFDNGEDIIRGIMENYACEKCDEKDKIIENNESRIQEFKSFIQKQQTKQPQVSQQKSVQEISTQTEQLSNSQDRQRAQLQLQLEQSNNSINSQPDKSDQSTNLKACHKILLNNYVRQFKEYVDNIDDQSSEKTKKMKLKISDIAVKQKITLFEEEEEPDSSLITSELIQDIMVMSLDMITDLLSAAQSAQMQFFDLGDQTQNEIQQSKIVEKIIEKKVEIFKTVDFGVKMPELKTMQTTARTERKACHQIIVEIEKLMYEMNTILNGSQDSQIVNASNSSIDSGTVQIFSKILDTYLQLPLRLKPIFDHCKKIESVLVKALKSQDEIVKSQGEEPPKDQEIVSGPVEAN